jgi:glyoxylase-like metal-dependent hydrolase (beta-lactamase superfamily II)
VRLEDLELEPEYLWLVLFGPGLGESILLAIPGSVQEWVLIDSLRRQARDGDANPALALLEAHAADLSAAILTHPHRDHVRGFTDLLDRLRDNAPLGCLGAHIIERPGRRDDADSILNRDTARAALARIKDIWEQRPSSRWDLLSGSERKVAGATLRVVHPKLAPAANPRDLNAISTPILLTRGQTSLLLGADLTIPGWRKVRREFPDAELLAETQALKASHHGSAGAQHPIAIGEPPRRQRVCAVTPFGGGQKPLPDYEDGGGMSMLLETHEAVEVTAVPPQGRGKSVPRSALQPQRTRFGELELIVEPAKATPGESWVAVAFGDSGEVVELRHGDAAGTVL